MGTVTECTAIVLAAGMGARLSSVHDAPKGFIEIEGQPIIARSLELLAQAGVTDLLFVIGWRAEMYADFLRARFPHARVVTNDSYEATGSLRSLACAAPHVCNDALIVESDLLYEARAVPALLQQPERDVVLLSGPTRSGDEVWVYAMTSGHLAQMVKDRLPNGSLAGELVGLSRVSSELLQDIAESAFELPAEARYEEGFNTVCQRRPISLFRVDGLVWCEIDTPEHLTRAREEVWPRIRAADAMCGAWRS